MEMKDTTLVIMAAGIGSRFGGGIKQLEPMGPNGEIIMDYSIHDAIEAGFNKVVFVIRKDLEETFKEVVGNRIATKVKVEYVFQEIDRLPAGFGVPEGRKKPWGTGQAILVCKDVVKEPFMVINADDYYGKEGFRKIHDYLTDGHTSDVKYDICMAGFILGNTLSDNGAVTRGVCVTDDSGHLVGVNETSGIVKTEGGAAHDVNGTLVDIDPHSHVSMNMWGFTPEFLDVLEEGFKTFLSGLGEGDIKSEYLLPSIVDSMIKDGSAAVTVLESNDKWFGVTYKEDKPTVVASIRRLIEQGQYPESLY
jgi:hypothetical protein